MSNKYTQLLMDPALIPQVINNLSNSSAIDGLAASMGKELRDRIINATTIPIVDDLTSGGSNKALSAEQGKILKTRLDAMSTEELKDLSTKMNGLYIDAVSRYNTYRGTDNFSLGANNKIQGVYWLKGAERLCAISLEGTTTFTPYSYISTDGKTWTKHAMPAYTKDMKHDSIVYVDEHDKLYVLIIKTGKLYIYSTNDGQIWQDVTSTSGASGYTNYNHISRIIWFSKEQCFVTIMIKSGAVSLLKINVDGTYTEHVLPATNWSSGSVVCEYSPELDVFCVCKHGNFEMIVGTNNITTFTINNYRKPQNTLFPTSTAHGSTTWKDIKWSPKLRLFCMISQSNNTGFSNVVVSSDGTTWDYYALPDFGFHNKLYWIEDLGIFIATRLHITSYTNSGPTNAWLVSADGYHWATKTFTGNAIESYSTIAYSPKLGKLFISSDPSLSTNSNIYHVWVDL